MDSKKITDAAKHSAGELHETLALSAIGLEAEFTLVLNGHAVKVEEIFRDPRGFVRGDLMHRVGTSYHLPMGGAVYFDTGVVEVATPLIEIARGCAARAGRSLWESILFVRGELDAWEARTGSSVHLVGFSSHYNVSFDHRCADTACGRTLDQFALLLSHILPLPTMLLAANPRSTGVGVRPRGDRIEVTVDFTPSAPLMIATATLITAIVRDVMAWPSFDLDALEDHHIPQIADFEPIPHTSRRGWLARFSCFPENPFVAGPDQKVWTVRGERAPASLRDIARRIFAHFRLPVARLSDSFTLRLLASIFEGRTLSLLDLPDRPASYDDVGRLCRWEESFPRRLMARTNYEQVLIRAIAGEKLRVGEDRYTPIGMRGWSRVVFTKDSDASRHVMPIDLLVQHLDAWGDS